MDGESVWGEKFFPKERPSKGQNIFRFLGDAVCKLQVQKRTFKQITREGGVSQGDPEETTDTIT